MRIAHLTGTSLPAVGGAEVLLHNLALEQARRGHDVTVIARWPIARLAPRRLPYRVVPLVPTTYHWSWRSALSPEGHWLLRRQLQLQQRLRHFDLWHVHMAHPAGWAAAGILEALGVPAVLTAHGADLIVDERIDYGFRLVPEIDERIRASLPAFDVVTAISPQIHDAFVDLGVAPGRIVDIPNGVDVERIGGHPADRAGVRERLGLAPDAELVLTVARYDREVKGLDSVPTAADQVARERPAMRWLVVGDGTAALGPELARLGREDVVRLDEGEETRVTAETLPGDWLIDLYRAADVFVLPSRVEGMPLVVLEAMAAGLPVVAADTPGCRRLVTHGENGLLYRPGDSSALAAAVIELLADDPERRTALGRAGGVSAAPFALADVADRYDQVYAGVHSREST